MSGKRQRKYSLPDKKPNVKTTQKARLVKGKYLCIITGAGHGIGRAIAGLAFQDQGILPDAWAGSKLCLIDIDEEALNETAGKKMRQFLAHRKITVDLFTIDLSHLDEIESFMRNLDVKYEKDFERVILINSAGSLGKLESLQQIAEDPSAIQKYFDLNITSKICMTNKVCKIFVSQAKSTVNVSSLDLNKPTSALGLPCMAASAIATFDAIFAKENPHVRVLHYVTERLDKRSTKRIGEGCNNTTLSRDIQELSIEGKLMSPVDAAKRLIKVLETTTFTNGEVIDVGAHTDE